MIICGTIFQEGHTPVVICRLNSLDLFAIIPATLLKLEIVKCNNANICI